MSTCRRLAGSSQLQPKQSEKKKADVCCAHIESRPDIEQRRKYIFGRLPNDARPPPLFSPSCKCSFITQCIKTAKVHWERYTPPALWGRISLSWTELTQDKTEGQILLHFAFSATEWTLLLFWWVNDTKRCVYISRSFTVLSKGSFYYHFSTKL